MSHRQRVPGTTSNVWRREIACAGDPTGALVQALAEFRAVRAGHIWSIGVSHDNGCPALEGGGMFSCDCEVVHLEARRAA
jgi:hypothetical protein